MSVPAFSIQKVVCFLIRKHVSDSGVAMQGLLPSLSVIESLSLSCNAFSDDGANALAKWIEDARPLNLTRLDVSDCDIHFQGALNLVAACRQLSPKWVLSLAWNPCVRDVSQLEAILSQADVHATPSLLDISPATHFTEVNWLHRFGVLSPDLLNALRNSTIFCESGNLIPVTSKST